VEERLKELRAWTTKDSSALYNVGGWSGGYFRINDAGHVEVLGGHEACDEAFDFDEIVGGTGDERALEFDARRKERAAAVERRALGFDRLAVLDLPAGEVVELRRRVVHDERVQVEALVNRSSADTVPRA
jgi:hypothetical protein